MRRWHFYLMGVIATLFGIVGMVEYVLVSYGLELGWLRGYSDAQIAWLRGLPDWVHGVWGAQATLALVGALCLVAHVRAAVWMLAFSFFAFLFLSVWALSMADPVLQSVVDGVTAIAVASLVSALAGLLWLYARSERRRGDLL
ncbi:MAG: hypothetical protein AAF919_08465 [Pseudomonadota bacterium]